MSTMTAYIDGRFSNTAIIASGCVPCTPSSPKQDWQRGDTMPTSSPRYIGPASKRGTQQVSIEERA